MSNPHTIHLNISFRNTEPTEAIKKYATEKLTNCLQKFVHQDVDAHIVLLVEKNRQQAEITFHADGKDFICKEESDDLYASLDKLTTSIGAQLRKHKEKRVSHH